MIGLQGRAESLAAKEAEAVALQKGERERERGDSSMRTPFIIRAISLLIK